MVQLLGEGADPQVSSPYIQNKYTDLNFERTALCSDCRYSAVGLQMYVVEMLIVIIFPPSLAFPCEQLEGVKKTCHIERLTYYMGRLTCYMCRVY